jgi:hypothetical protein
MVEAPGMPLKIKKDDNSQSTDLIILGATFICLNLGNFKFVFMIFAFSVLFFPRTGAANNN